MDLEQSVNITISYFYDKYIEHKELASSLVCGSADYISHISMSDAYFSAFLKLKENTHF